MGSNPTRPTMPRSHESGIQIAHARVEGCLIHCTRCLIWRLQLIFGVTEGGEGGDITLTVCRFKRFAVKSKRLPPCGHVCGPVCPADKPRKITRIKPETPNRNDFVFISRIVPTGGRGWHHPCYFSLQSVCGAQAFGLEEFRDLW